MPFFFADSSGVDNRGRVQMLMPPGAALPGSLVAVTSPPSDVTGGEEIPWGGFTNFKALITDLTIAEHTNHQFLHTLGGAIYIYSFGDRIGTLGIGGVAAYDNCGDGSSGPIGISHVLDFYRKTRLTSREEPLKVTLAPDTVLRGFSYQFRGQVMDVGQRLFQFHLDLALIPERSEI